MKAARHNMILELIGKFEIETQEELMQKLKEQNCSVTQATISRDIKQLKLVKVLTPGGKYKYAPAQVESNESTPMYIKLFSESVVEVGVGGNIVCIKCRTGMAQAVCANMDSMRWEGLIGTLAGEDTIFALCSDDKKAGDLAAQFRRLFKVK